MTLLSHDSIQYKKRLVRELNKEGMVNGFYAPLLGSNLRSNRARIKGGMIQCRSLFDGGWFFPSNEHFDDCNGREINASIVA